MIKVRFFIKGESLSGFKITGHSGYSAAGSDIVCAAVSSAAYMAANTITDVLGAKASVSADDGAMSLMLNNKPCEKCAAVLKGLQMHLSALAEDYPENITIIYGGVKNA